MNNKEIEQSARDRFGIPRKLEDISEEELRQAITECKTFAGVRLRLGLGSEGCTNDDVKKRCAEAGIDCKRLRNKKASRWEMYTDDEITNFIAISDTLTEVALLVGYEPSNVTVVTRLLIEKGFIQQNDKNIGEKLSRDILQDIVYECHTFSEVAKITNKSIKYIHKMLNDMDIDHEHFDPFYYSLCFEQLQEGTSPSHEALRRILKYFGIKTCEICGNNGHWQDKDITLQVHHRNGMHNDNRLENLMLLCPTCHAQLEQRGTKDKKHSKTKQSIYQEYGRKCQTCGKEKWLGKIMPLELHHRDGNRKNNETNNLSVLCPNCHAATENFTGKNLPAGSQNKQKVNDDKLIETLSQSTSIGQALNKLSMHSSTHNYERARKLIDEYQISLLPIITMKEPQGATKSGAKTETKTKAVYVYKPNRCQDCGAEISYGAIYCIRCYEEHRRENIPLREELKNKIRHQSFTALAREYGVSDQAIKKWCKIRKLPWLARDIKSFTDEEWSALEIFTEEMVSIKPSYTDDDLVTAYKKCGSMDKVAHRYGCDYKVVKRACQHLGYSKETDAFAVIAKDIHGDVVKSFASIANAAEWICQSGKSKMSMTNIGHTIKRTIMGSRAGRLAYGYYWQAADNEKE